jgi:hypothetical protein
VQPPEAGASAVFVDGFHVPVALARPWHRTRYFRQESLGRLVAVKDAVFTAFLVIDHELHRDMRTARPCRIRWIGSIAAHVTQITHVRKLQAGNFHRQSIQREGVAFPSKNLKVFLGSGRAAALMPRR